jgi:hypothetical protein
MRTDASGSQRELEPVRVAPVAPIVYGVYCSDNSRSQLEQTEWIIRGTDGQLYLVTSEAGG